MKEKIYWLLLGLLSFAYLCLASALPTASGTLTRYNVSQAQTRILAVAMALALVIIWFIALLGFVNLKEYALKIKEFSRTRAS